VPRTDRTRYTLRTGWQALHAAIDDHSRVGFSLMRAEETAEPSCRLYRAAAAAWACKSAASLL